MVGITAFGAYVPMYRLSGQVVGGVWGEGAADAERSVANYDEDSLTMAVEATLNCLAGRDPRGVEGLLFASTTAPYAEKQNATLIATVADLPAESFTADLAHSLRAGTAALRCAVDAVKSGSARSVVVAAADCRLAEAGSDLEMTLGDAGAALLIGQEGVVASIEGLYSLNYEFTDVWRKRQDRYLNQADARFVQTYGYERCIKNTLSGLMKKYELRPEQIAKVVYYAPDIRTHRTLMRPLGFKPEAYQDGRLLTTVGNAGAAAPFLSLIAALEEAQPGDRIVLVSYGNGADAVLLQVTEQIRELQGRPGGLKTQLASKRPLVNYGKYLHFRELVETDKILPYSSPILLWREIRADLQLYGQRCRPCGAIQYPMRRVCWRCGTKDEFDDAKLARHGTVVTFTKDHLVPTPDPPVIMVTADLEGGGRLYCQLTDCDPQAVQIGMTVEATFRKYHEGEGFNNYFWKFRSIRAA